MELAATELARQIATERAADLGDWRPPVERERAELDDAEKKAPTNSANAVTKTTPPPSTQHDSESGGNEAANSVEPPSSADADFADFSKAAAELAAASVAQQKREEEELTSSLASLKPGSEPPAHWTTAFEGWNIYFCRQTNKLFNYFVGQTNRIRNLFIYLFLIDPFDWFI